MATQLRFSLIEMSDFDYTLSEGEMKNLWETINECTDTLLEQPMSSLERSQLSQHFHALGDKVAAALTDYMHHTGSCNQGRRSWLPKVGGKNEVS